MEEKIINTVTEEVLEVAEEITTADVSRKGLGKKVTIGVLAVALVAGAAKLGYNYYKKVKKAKSVEMIDEDPTEIFDETEDYDFDDTTK